MLRLCDKMPWDLVDATECWQRLLPLYVVNHHFPLRSCLILWKLKYTAPRRWFLAELEGAADSGAVDFAWTCRALARVQKRWNEELAVSMEARAGTALLKGRGFGPGNVSVPFVKAVMCYSRAGELESLLRNLGDWSEPECAFTLLEMIMDMLERVPPTRAPNGESNGDGLDLSQYMKKWFGRTTLAAAGADHFSAEESCSRRGDEFASTRVEDSSSSTRVEERLPLPRRVVFVGDVLCHPADKTPGAVMKMDYVTIMLESKQGRVWRPGYAECMFTKITENAHKTGATVEYLRAHMDAILAHRQVIESQLNGVPVPPDVAVHWYKKKYTGPTQLAREDAGIWWDDIVGWEV